MQKTFVFVVVCFFYFNSRGQGCSDAGVCTINSIKGGEIGKEDTVFYKQKLEIGCTYGVGDDFNHIVSPYVGYTAFFNKKISISTRYTGALITGKKGTVINVGDIFITTNFLFYSKKNIALTGTIGTKVPLNYANASSKGNPLPLSYQTSLATVDGIVGLAFISKYVDVSTAFQYPFFQGNRNAFFSSGNDTLIFQTTNKFERKPDVILKTTGHYTFLKNKLKITAGLLGIYHIGNDTYEDVDLKRKEIKNAAGLTLNIVASLLYKINLKNEINVDFGTPVIVRKIRPDGLTRKFVVGISYVRFF